MVATDDASSGTSAGEAEAAAEREAASLREVVLDLLTDEPQDGARLTARVREEWGEASPHQVAAALRVLRGEGRAAPMETGWVRLDVEDDDDEEL